MKMKIFSFLPKSATFTFQQNPPPFSPGRENNNHKSHVNKGFSGQLIPDEARRKSSRGFYSTQEPTSPKVSCMGQIKLKKKVRNSSKSTTKEEQDHQKKNKKRVKNKDKPSKTSEVVVIPAVASSKISKEESNKKFDSFVSNKKPSLEDTKAAPSLDQMKRFASGRDSLANFDWRDFNDDGGNGQEEEVFIAHSAPLMMGGGGRVSMEPKKEINLWKRRTTAPPKPLQINVTNKDE